MEKQRIGIVGGGQLGRMLTEAALPMGFRVAVVDPTFRQVERVGKIPNSPALQAGAEQILGDLDDPESLTQLAESVDVTTWEIEHINALFLVELERQGYDIQPSPEDLSMIQNKLRQKEFLRSRGLPVADFYSIDGPEDLDQAISNFGACVVKTRRGGYDGRGNLVLADADWAAVRQRFPQGVDLYAERLVDFRKELSVLVARDRTGQMATYPVIETIQEHGQCAIAIAPARIPPYALSEARSLALNTVDNLRGSGVFAIEMFLGDEGLMINEIAPRVHNSGHLTIEASPTSQFEQHIRAISGLPLGETKLRRRAAAMINILGERDGEVRLTGLERALSVPDAHLHVYGKEPTKQARKMGHLTVLADSEHEAVSKATKARREISI